MKIVLLALVILMLVVGLVPTTSAHRGGPKEGPKGRDGEARTCEQPPCN